MEIRAKSHLQFSTNFKVLLVLIFLRLSYFPRAILGTKIYYILYYAALVYLLIDLTKGMKSGKKRKTTYIMLPLLLYISIYLIKILTSNRFDLHFFSPLTDVVNLLNLFIVVFLGINLSLSSIEKKIASYWTCVVLFSSSFYSYIYMIFIDPLALRRGNAVHLGVIDFSIIYAIIFVPIIFNYHYSKYNSDRKSRLFKLSFMTFFLLFLMKSGFITAVLLYLVSILFSEISSYRSIRLNSILKLSFLSFILIFVFRNQVAWLVYQLAMLFESNWVISNKLIAISNVFKGNFTNLDTLGDRFVLILRSLNSFIKHPLIGIRFDFFNQLTVGNHAQWFDDLAKMGFTFILYLNFLWKYIKHSGLFRSDSNLVAMLVFVLLGFLNPNLSGPITFILFLVIFPTLYENDDCFVVEKDREESTSKSNPLVTIIVPAYNAINSISRTINSILAQTYSNIEIIVVNDGSTDETEKLVKSFIEIDDRIRLINQENGGVSLARNTGIDAANGEFISFLDADDLYLPSFIDSMIVDKADLMFAGYNTFLNGKTKKVDVNWQSLIGITHEKLLNLYLSRKINLHTSNWMIKKKILIENNIRFETGLNWCEDVLFFSSVLLQSNVVFFIPEYLSVYSLDVFGSLSSAAISRIESEKKAMTLLKKKVDANSSLISVIDYYRIPATTLYTLVDLKNNGEDIKKYESIYRNNMSIFKNPNGLRSFKLNLVRFYLHQYYRKDAK